MIACGIFIEFLSIHEGQFDQIIPGKIGLIKQMLHIFLKIFPPHRRKPTNPIKSKKPLMLIPKLLYWIQEVLYQNLCNFFRSRSDDKPFIQIMFERHQWWFRFYWLIVIKDLVNSYYWYQTTCDSLVKCEWCNNVLKKIWVHWKLVWGNRNNRRLLGVIWGKTVMGSQRDVENLSRRVFFEWSVVQVLFKLTDMVLLLPLLLFDLLFHPFILNL